MTEYTAITPESHGTKKWHAATDYAFAATETAIPLVGAELSKTVSAMPTGFIEQGAGYQLVAIASLQPGLSLYVTPDGKWLGPYIPAALRAYPFRLLRPESAEKSILCINEASGLVIENIEDGNAFFDDQNQPTKKVKDILNFLSEVEAGLAVIQGAVNALDDAGIITPWELNLKQGEEIVPVTGLFCVDEAALNKLDNDAFLTLREAGGLAIAYAQLLSMNQLTVLERLDQLRGQVLEQQAAASAPLPFDFLVDQGSISFEDL